MSKIYKFVFVMLLMSISMQFSAQETISEEPVNDAKREEVQRYFGYELLLYRYLSLPYDTTINLNQQGNFVDIGFLYLVFIPVLLLFLLRSNKGLYFLSFGLLIVMWIVSMGNSYYYSKTKLQMLTSEENIKMFFTEVPWPKEPFCHIVAWIYKLNLSIYSPLEKLGLSISGNSDYVTYPIIFILFIMLSLVLVERIKHWSLHHKSFFVFFWIYGFYWFAFSGGIIWYGYILMIAGLFVIQLMIEKLNAKNPKIAKYIRGAFYGLAGLWLLLCTFLRFSNIQPLVPEAELGKGLYNPIFYDYGCGKFDKDKALDTIYTNVSRAMKRINEDESSLILRVGTSFTYFIKNNHVRVVGDNQLGLFYGLRRRYKDNQELMDVIKASNFKFLIVDLNTATIDNTPNKSLTNKYRDLLLFLIDNPNIELLATDRIVQVEDESGKLIYVYDIYGERIQHFGRYAIFEII